MGEIIHNESRKIKGMRKEEEEDLFITINHTDQ